MKSFNDLFLEKVLFLTNSKSRQEKSLNSADTDIADQPIVVPFKKFALSKIGKVTTPSAKPV